MRNILAVTALAVILTGCSTPYQDMGLLGGVSELQLTDSTAQITARGNGFTDADAIQRFVMRKAAETTISAGFDLFEIIQTNDRSSSLTEQSIHVGAGYAYGNSWNIIKPGSTVLIKMRKGTLASDSPSNVFDAHQIIKYLGQSETKDARKCKTEGSKVTCDEPL